MSTVTYRRDEIATIAEERRAELRALAARPDSEIDYRDIPPLTDEQLEEFVPRAFYRPIKKHTSMRLDADILAWLKHRSNGKGYQAYVNAILREAMLRERMS
jgi:uncharacterized protein (DUF4415 family)